MLNSVHHYIKKYNIVPMKKYGQNFILHNDLCEKMIKVSEITSDSSVLEIGPGLGNLTRCILLKNSKSLTVVELDKRCIPLLMDMKLLYKNLDVIHSNALSFDLTILENNLHIISNLPYNIGTKLLLNLIKHRLKINNIVVMLQKEVVNRIISKPHLKSYGRLSVICQIIFDVKKCFNVSSGSFYPSPKVDSSVIKLVPHNDLSDTVLKRLEWLTKLAFAQRRKLLKNVLNSIHPDFDSILNLLNIDEYSRAENLSPNDYLSLTMSSFKLIN